jgi:hypothetical protein
MLGGLRHAYAGPFFFGEGPFPGMEPAGDYPIHIIVKSGKTMLLGVVDNQGDRTIAEMKARQVPGAFGVENHLVALQKSKPTAWNS